MFNITQIKDVKGTRFSGITYKTEVKPAAAYKNLKIEKVVTANVQIFGSLSDYTDVYLNAVKKSGKRIEENDMEKLLNFEKSETWFQHSKDCFSIVEHKQTGKKYLFAIFNNASSKFLLEGKEVEKEDILQYLTPSEAKKLTEDNSIVYNKRNDVLHTVICRTVGIDNILEMR